MKHYNAKDILNIVVAGHGGCGKTSLSEAMLFLSGATDRLGRIEDGNTLCDFDMEEVKRRISITEAVAPLEWKGKKINIIDTPGLFDFERGLCEGVRVADTALITVSGKSGVMVGTRKAVKAAEKRGLAKIFFVNGLCDEDSRFYRVFESLKANFGPAVCPVVVPFIVDGKAECYVNILEYKAYSYSTGKITEVPMPDMGNRLDGLRTAIYEAVAETSDEMFEKYFSGESFTPEEVIVGVSKGVKEGKIYPVFCGDAQTTYGVEHLLNGLSWLAPSAKERGAEIAESDDGEPIEISVDDTAEPVALVFKTVSDPFIGKLSYFKVISGKISPDMNLTNMRTNNVEKISKVFIAKGKKQEPTEYIVAGDIGVTSKLQDTKTGDTLCSPNKKVTLDSIMYPIPSLSMAIYPKNKGDEDKIVQGLLRLEEEDPTIRFENCTEIHQMIVWGLGEQHLDVLLSKLKSKFGVEAYLERPKVAYRETIKKRVQVQGRHKKQTGGHGQFGDVWIEFEPGEKDGLEFCERVVGGAVPKGFFPAVEKGLLECIQKGPLAGYPVVRLKATLYDGSYHPVDSSEMSFKMAAAQAYKNGMPMAQPVLLEPIGKLEAYVSDSNMGDVIGEINKRRGRILGMTPCEDGIEEISAEVPVSEMYDFSTFMRQSTQGEGYFNFRFERYEQAPADISQKVIQEHKCETQK